MARRNCCGTHASVGCRVKAPDLPRTEFDNERNRFLDVELASRRIVHFSITAHPTDKWVAQQLRATPPLGQAPRFLIRDRDSKDGRASARVAKDSSIEIPNNAVSRTESQRNLRKIPRNRTGGIP
jgi:hypothetical protein